MATKPEQEEGRPAPDTAKRASEPTPKRQHPADQRRTRTKAMGSLFFHSFKFHSCLSSLRLPPMHACEPFMVMKTPKYRMGDRSFHLLRNITAKHSAKTKSPKNSFQNINTSRAMFGCAFCCCWKLEQHTKQIKHDQKAQKKKRVKTIIISQTDSLSRCC